MTTVETELSRGSAPDAGVIALVGAVYPTAATLIATALSYDGERASLTVSGRF